MNSKLITLLILLIFSFINAKGQSDFKTIQLDTDTVISTWIKEIVNDDSIKTLEYNKKSVDYSDDFTQERIVYINMHNNALDDKINEIKKSINTIISEKNYIARDNKKDYKTNQYSETYNMYIPIYKINDNYVVFKPDFEHPRIISDRAFMYKDDEGLLYYHFLKFSKINDSYKIEYAKYQNRIREIVIKPYDKENEIQVWKETHERNNKKHVNYRLYIPLEKSKKYPVLNIINTSGLDEVTDKFDNLELEKRF